MALLCTIWKYFFKEYFEFGSVSPFWIWRENICARVLEITVIGIIKLGGVTSAFECYLYSTRKVDNTG